MSVTGIQSSNGIFTITGANGQAQQVDLGTLIMMLKLDQTANLDQQLAVHLEEIQERNTLISQLTELLSICRKLKAEGGDDGCPTGVSSNGSGKVTIGGVTKTLQGKDSWSVLLGLEWTDLQGKRSESDNKDAWDATWDANINNIKSKVDTLNNDSQLANIKLQNVLEKRNNAFEMATKAMDTNNTSVQSTLRNL